MGTTQTQGGSRQASARSLRRPFSGGTGEPLEGGGDWGALERRSPEGGLLSRAGPSGLPLWSPVGVRLLHGAPEQASSTPGLGSPPGGERRPRPSSPSQLRPSPALAAGVGDSGPLVAGARGPRTCSHGPPSPRSPDNEARGLAGAVEARQAASSATKRGALG